MHTTLRHVSIIISTIHKLRSSSPSGMSSRRKRQVPARMSKNERPCDEIPDNDNADAQYTALLLREEELIEAVRMVDSEEASKMESKLDKITRAPWSKLEQSDQSSDEIRLDRLHSIERARNEAEEAIQKEIQQAALKEAHEEKIRQQEARLALQQDQKVLSDGELTQAILAFISKRSRPKRCPDNGEYSWSGKVFHVKQQIKWKAEDDSYLARDISRRLCSRNLPYKTPRIQFWRVNQESVRYSRLLPEHLAYRPVDAVTLSNKKGADYALKLAAKRIWIIVTHADDEDEYQRLF